MLADSFAWMEVFMGGPRGEQFRDAMAAEEVVYTCPTVLAEVYSRIARVRSPEVADRYAGTILDECALIATDENVAALAGRIHAEMKSSVKGFGMADSFVLAAARSRGVRVLTGDPHFAGVPDAVVL